MMRRPMAENGSEQDRREEATTWAHDEADLLRPGEDATPQRLGRYAVLGTIGRGGMGVVYRAYDPDLDRAVALKLLTPGSKKSEASARMVREAQAMAKLSHPNVVPVHDVGVQEGRVFIAMEFVRGMTLGKWAEGRPWQEVVAAYVQAGRGLAAAHAVGLIHRDFKPDNCLVREERDGLPHVLVLDFGLAKVAEEGETEPLPAADAQELVEVGGESQGLTRTGALLGTPAFMSPEQHSGARVDAKSDQFSFCVALYEGLYGERPFGGVGLVSIAFNVLQGRRRPLPRNVDVPRWVQEVIDRGLALDPNDRFESMDRLLARLEPRDRKSRLGLWIGASGLATMAAVVGALGSRAAVVEPCSNASDEMAEVWNDTRRQAIEQSFAATGLAYAADSGQLVTTGIDRWAETWVEIRTEACEATQVHKTQSENMLDLRVACLDRRLAELDTLVGLLEKADAKLVEKSVRVAAELGGLELCSDTQALASAVPPPEDPEVVVAVQELERELSAVRMLMEAGRAKEAHDRAREADARAADMDYPPIRARALYVLGDAEAKDGHRDDSVKTLERAALLALESGADRTAVHALRQLAFVEGGLEGRAEPARRWISVGLALVPRLGDPVHERSQLLGTLGNVEITAANNKAAAELLEKALQLRSDEPTIGMASSLLSLGAAQLRAGEYEEGRATLQRSLEIHIRLQGARHPDVALVYNNLALVHERLGELERSAEFMQRSLDILEPTLGPEHPTVGVVTSNLGLLLFYMGKVEEAQGPARRGVEILEAALGPDHQALGRALNPLGHVRMAQGRHEEARALFQRSLDIRSSALGPDHHDVGLSALNLGRLELMLGETEQAKQWLERAVTLIEAADPDPMDLAEARDLLGRSLWALGEREKAEALLEQARLAYVDVGVRASRLLDEHDGFRRRTEPGVPQVRK